MFILFSTVASTAVVMGAFLAAQYYGWDYQTTRMIATTLVIVPFLVFWGYTVLDRDALKKEEDRVHEDVLDVLLSLGAVALVGFGFWIYVFLAWVTDGWSVWFGWIPFAATLATVFLTAEVIGAAEWAQRYRLHGDEQGHSKEHLIIAVLPQVGASIGLTLYHHTWEYGGVLAWACSAALMAGFGIYAYRKGVYARPGTPPMLPAPANDETPCQPQPGDVYDQLH